MFDHLHVHPAGEHSTTNETMPVYKRISAFTGPPMQAGDGAVQQLNGMARQKKKTFTTTKP